MEEKKSSGQPVYASVGRRFVASLVDGLILGLVFVPFSLVLGGYNYSTQTSGSEASPFFTLFMTLVQWAYYVYFTGSKGQTLGKMALGIKVVRKDGVAPVGYGKGFMREIVGKLISSVVLALGYLWAIWDKEKQTWHDKIAGTIVVRI
jgi:uncharacterized RDD family membrane protein YckC